MIKYTTQVHVKKSFHREILLSMFFQWLQTSKNRMEHFRYTNENPFVLRENRKCLKIEDFVEAKILGIQFTTSDNYKNAQFVVEVMYHYENQMLNLVFYKELNMDSKYIEAISVPKIFDMLLKSDFIENDGNLKIQNAPMFLTETEYKKLFSSKGRLPWVVLRRNKKCIVNPVMLAQRLFGLAHVICVYSKREMDMQIFFQDEIVENGIIGTEKQMIRSCFEKILNYAIEQQAQYYSFEDLVQSKLYQQMINNDELNNYYKESVEQMIQEVEEYRELYQMTLSQFNSLKAQKKEYEDLLNRFQKENILISSNQEHEKRELVIRLIQKKLNALNNNEVYRRRDVLQSISEENTL